MRFETDSRKRSDVVFPMYLVIDVSMSMGIFLPEMTDALRAVVARLSSDPLIGNVLNLAVITYSDTARLVLPSTAVAEISEVPELRPEGATSFAAAFRLTRESMRIDIIRARKEGRRVYRPAVLFTTDGTPVPGDPWPGELEALRGQFRPNIVALGLTGNEDPQLLQRVASWPEVAFTVRRGVPLAVAFGDVALTLASSISNSVNSGTESTRITFPSSVDRTPTFD